MNVLIKEKEVISKNHEEDTKKVLYKMLQHLREIKSLRKKLNSI